MRGTARQLLGTSWHEPYRHAYKSEALGRRHARGMASWPFRCGGGYPAPQVVPAPTRSANSCPMAPATAVARRARPWDVAAHRGVRSWRFRSLGAALCRRAIDVCAHQRRPATRDQGNGRTGVTRLRAWCENRLLDHGPLSCRPSPVLAPPGALARPRLLCKRRAWPRLGDRSRRDEVG